MDAEKIKQVVIEVIEMVSDIEEPYKNIAFRVILEKQIGLERQSRQEPFLEITKVIVEDKPINEYFAELKIGSLLEGTLALAYYLLKHEEMETFNARDLSDAYQKARLGASHKPRNISDAVANCAKKGWIAEAKEKKEKLIGWFVTQSGER